MYDPGASITLHARHLSRQGGQTGNGSVNLERIWAPWRLEYIRGEAPKAKPLARAALLPGADAECFLCQCAPEGDDAARLVVARNELGITVLNRYPYNNGHLLVAPRRHVGRLDDLRDQEQLELGRMLTRMVGLLEQTMGPDGFNVGLNLGRAGGAGVPEHLHWHIVPRWSGDTNFMPTLAGVRVIPQSLEALWELLTGHQQRPK